MPPGSASRVDSDIELGIATDKVCHLIVKARAFDAKEAEADADPDSGSSDSKKLSWPRLTGPPSPARVRALNKRSERSRLGGPLYGGP
jgi:hypothetical protein